ncbi:MAG: hypothetical protein L0Y42_07505 [Phycisphaerales bacterium]|nr:hypothetical protein [Phycisphaerales bacterium]
MVAAVCLLCGGAAIAQAPRPAAPEAAKPVAEQVISVFDAVELDWDRAVVGEVERQGHQVLKNGQMVQTKVSLPRDGGGDEPADLQIIVRVTLEPVIVQEQGKPRPGDPWTRLGSATIVIPQPAKPGGKPTTAQVELIRFITSFGGPGVFEQDITALAPLLQGQTTFQLLISTYKKPAWKASLSLIYRDRSAGYRRPAWAKPLFNEEAVTAQKGTLKATIDVPRGLDRPRLWITSTGHATDGTGGDEFVSRTHLLKIDGHEVARWRPWVENGATLRRENPMSGRVEIDGRELWSSDIDRSGWHPGRIVEPVRIPVPELTAGKHTLELEIRGIRPKDDKGHGYWRLSAVAVADEPWPQVEQTDREPADHE